MVSSFAIVLLTTSDKPFCRQVSFGASVSPCMCFNFFCRIYPEWNVHSEFINDHLNKALNLDAKLSSHPIEVECPDANQINQIFDSLSYSKAASGTFSLLRSSTNAIIPRT